MDLYFALKGSPDDIVCLRKEAHLPSCLKCTDSFASISRLKDIIAEKLDYLKTSYKRVPTSPQDADAKPIASTTNPPLSGGGVRENEDLDSDSDLDSSTDESTLSKNALAEPPPSTQD
jgi:hypothetical protein